jgi:cold shock CspA family protein
MAGLEVNSNTLRETDVELTGTVDWYSSDKGYGFIKLPNMVEGVYVNERTLKGAEINSIVEGDTLKFLARRGDKGMFVASIISVNEGLDVLRGQKIYIVRIFWERGYGFARIEGLAEDIFFHFSALSNGLVHSIDTNDVLHADIIHDVANAEYRIRSISV